MAKQKCMIVLSVVMFFLLFSVPQVSAGCVDTSSVNKWSYIDSTKFIAYSGSRPVALIQIMIGCMIFRTSDIMFLDSFSCNMSPILIDKEKCTIWSIERL